MNEIPWFLPCLLSQKWWNRTCLVALRCEHLFARRQKKAWIHTDTWNHFGRPWLLCCHYCQCPLLSFALFFVWSTLAPGVKKKAPSHGNPSWLVCSWSPLRLESLDLGGNGLDPSAAQFPGLKRVWVCQGCSVFFTDVVVSWYFFQDLCEALGFTAFLFQGDEGEFSSCTGEVKIDLECCYSEKPGQNGQAASAAIQTCQWCKLLSQIVQKYWIYLNLGKIQLCASHKLETLVRTFEMLTRQTASHGYHIKFPPNHHWYQVFLCFSLATWCFNCLGSDSRCWTLIHCNDRFCWS